VTDRHDTTIYNIYVNSILISQDNIPEIKLVFVVLNRTLLRNQSIITSIEISKAILFVFIDNLFYSESFFKKSI